MNDNETIKQNDFRARENKELREKIACYQKENDCLKTEIAALKSESNKNIDAPIRVAESLIHAEYEYENDIILKAFSGITVAKSNVYSKSELRQIAEHLLVYCNRTEE